MRILQVNKFFNVRGGSERYYFDLCDLLTSRGHAVNHFSMADRRNRPSADEAYFVSAIDLNSCRGIGPKARAAARILYSREATSKIGQLMDSRHPDVVHLHNISRQLSPSVIDAAHRRSIPVVQTLHDFSLACPAHTFFVNGSPCEDCKQGSFWHAARKRCIDGSTASSLLGAFEAYCHGWLGLYKKVGRFLAPSLFLKSKIAALGWTADRLIHLPYFIPLGSDSSERNDGYVLFAGRMTNEKGVGTLIDAASICKASEFVLAGEGPQMEQFRHYAHTLSLTNVRFTGYAEGNALEKLLAGASCVVVSSISYENLPLSILEAFARGKPAVVSDSGGNRELVRDGLTGYVFERGVAASLADGIERLCSDEGQRVKMGKNARELVATEYSPARHYTKLLAIYEDVIR